MSKKIEIILILLVAEINGFSLDYFEKNDLKKPKAERETRRYTGDTDVHTDQESFFKPVQEEDKQNSIEDNHAAERQGNRNTTFSRRQSDIIDIYPAIPDFGKGQDNIIFPGIRQDNVWYVPEKYPCWKLPMLYGRLDKTKNDIFKIHFNQLVDVQLYNKTNKKEIKRSHDNLTPAPSSWCTIQPCYGDHTMCLFPNPYNSKICDKGYTVNTPDVSEQEKIISTINSMRNQVALGRAYRYKHLPTAANMQQVMYSTDLARMAKAWLHQCLPGPALCVALENVYIGQLECTKFSKRCCPDLINGKYSAKCIPAPECYVNAIIGCIHTWFASAGEHLTEKEVKCGHIARTTYNTAQLLWAETSHVGCAVGKRKNHDERVICHFAPGASFELLSKLYCGLVPIQDTTENFNRTDDVTSIDFLSNFGVQMVDVNPNSPKETHPFSVNEHGKSSRNNTNTSLPLIWGVDSLYRYMQPGWVSHLLNGPNGTLGLVARLVTRYELNEDTESKCDSGQTIYEPGPPGYLCDVKGDKFQGLCHEYRDPSPGYRTVALLAPVALFTLIIYDLFSGVVRQNNYF